MNKFTGRFTAYIRQFKIHHRLVAGMIISLFLYCSVIFGLSRLISYNIVNGYVNEYVKSTQQTVVSSVEVMLNEINITTIGLRTNMDIYDTFRDGSLSYGEKESAMKSILRETIMDSSAIGDINFVVYRGDSLECYSYESLITRIDENYLNALDASVSPVVGDMIKDRYGNFYIPYGAKMRNFYTSENIGYLVVYISERAICDIYSQLVPDWGYSFIVSPDNVIISHTNKDGVGKVVLDTDTIYSRSLDYKKVVYDGERAFLANYNFDERLINLGINWTLVSVIKENKLFAMLDRLNLYILVIVVIAIAAGILLSISVSLRITRSITGLRNKVKSFGDGNLDISPIERKKGDEIWELENSFNKMMVNINELIQKNNLEKEKQREMELTALQAQINPHFLYNTLDAIGWMAKLKDQKDIELLVLALAKFFRLSLHKGEKFIAVHEEIQLVKSFIQIQQVRLPGKFEVAYNLRDEMMNIKMLKIILQPLIENSIKHGFNRKREKGLITVNGRLSGDEMIFEVIDNGTGFDAGDVYARKPSGNVQPSGYGIRNVDERIKLEYGNEYGLTIESEPGKGAKVTVKLRAYPEREY